MLFAEGPELSAKLMASVPPTHRMLSGAEAVELPTYTEQMTGPAIRNNLATRWAQPVGPASPPRRWYDKSLGPIGLRSIFARDAEQAHAAHQIERRVSKVAQTGLGLCAHNTFSIKLEEPP
jgi:hypothetical protein